MARIPNKRRRKQQQKKGVVLLIIVTLLTLFIMIGITFALMATSYKDAGERIRSAGTYGDRPERELDLALAQLIYGSSSITAVSPHNLLGDLYGNDGVVGTVTALVQENQQQVINITYQQSAQQPFGLGFNPLRHFYAGRVLTFTDGPAAGLSTRVLGYLPTAGAAITGTLFVDALDTDALPSVGSRFIINGAPFNGTGYGYLASKYKLDGDEFGGDYVTSGNAQFSLLPHHAGFATLPSNYTDSSPDEPWDAPDIGNLHLSVVPPGRAIDPTLPIIPSFARPALVNYWANEPSTGAGGNWQQIPINRLRQINLRPIGREFGNNADHPQFDGSNANYSPTGIDANGQPTPWDVDNDGDGIADSIWIDPQLPIVTDPSGRKYKRLFAYLIKDLDGRIDINVHGNLNQTLAQNRADQGTPQLGLFPGGNLIRGSGYGAAEVDFLQVFGNFGTANDVTAYRTLMQQRYANDGLPGTANTRDGFNIVKHHGTPNDYANPPVLHWGFPPDVWGRGAIALDSSGNPITQYMGQTGEMLDNPYEIHVGQYPLAADAPYTLAEYEALLRYHDPSSQSISSRLFNTGSGQRYLNVNSPGSLGDDQRRREVLTTRSRSLPVAMARIPAEFFTPDASQTTKTGFIAADTYIKHGDQRNPTILTLYTYKLLRDGGFSGPGDPGFDTAFNAIIPWEIRHGQLFDLNRFLGNGWDDNGDGVPDDYNESASGSETAWLNSPQVPQTFGGATAWHTNDTDVTGDGAYNGSDFVNARQLYARHLFCLMMLLIDDGYLPPLADVNPALSQGDIRELFVQRLAQWAINVVDFRDGDAVMSGFEYDMNPFNGWSVDGNLGTDGSAGLDEMILINGVLTPVQTTERRVVWGLEFPDLVMTETIATHDRRVRDTSFDTSTTNVDGGDPHADQLRLPQGSLFIELYCPRAKQANNPRLPRELYAQDPMTGQWRLNLQKLSPQPSLDGMQRPVWRLAISEHTGPNAPTSVTDQAPWNREVNNHDSTSFEPDDMSLLPGVPASLPIDRYVWFSSIDPTAGVEMGRTFVNSLGWDVSIEPGQYAIVGPRTVTYMGSQTDAAGATPTAAPLHLGDSPQGIILSQINPPAGGNGAVVTGLAGTQTYVPGTGIKNIVGIVADMAPPASWLNQAKRVGVNVTEPLPSGAVYYQEPVAANDFYDDPNAPTNTFIDEPFDQRAGYPLADWGMLPTGTYDNVRAIFLQRLADPNAAWHAQFNPYITIDWAQTDATVFTGEETTDVATTGGNSRDPMADPMPSPPNPLRFASRQKGVDWLTQPLDVNLWTDEWIRPQDTPPTLPRTVFHHYDFLVDASAQPRSTFGYLNRGLGTPQPDNVATAQSELGDPTEGPFPWLGHLDRPFTSPMELMLVPWCTPGTLTHWFQPLGQPNMPRTTAPYDAANMAYQPMFDHLLNFFQTGDPTATPRISPQFNRLFNFVEVPSPFSGTEQWFNAQVFGTGTGTAADTFRPPFNKLSLFGDPGKININTVYDDWVLEAVLGSFPFPGNQAANQAFRQQLIISRQGCGTTPLAMDPAYPTRFANPFRPADAADLMPNVATMRKTNPVEATLLRSNSTTGTPSTTPLFDFPSQTPNNYNDSNRNAYFEFQQFQRIGNLFSTQSNVHAVWITVGYFEVIENRPGGGQVVIDAAHPDGYQLGQEIGADGGGASRHRSFFIIDRSIPVAYEPGKRHNTDRMILLRRFIE